MSTKNKVIPETEYAILMQLRQKNEELEKRLKKQNGIPLKLAGRYFRSKFHDYEAYGSWYERDKQSDQLIAAEKGYVFDNNMIKIFFNTAAMRDFLDGKTNSCPFYIEETPQ